VIGPLAERLAAGVPLLLDGALGTELDRRGVRTFLPLWSALGMIEAPAVVKQIHLDYARAGADVLITDTFRTTRRTLRKAGRDGDEAAVLNELAVRLAREAANEAGSDALIAGSIAPLEECYSPWLSPEPEVAFAEHREQAALLADAGADLLMVETMPLIREAVVAGRAALETGLEVTVGFVLGDDGRLLSGETLADMVAALAGLPISAILINCTPRNATTSALRALRELTDLPIGGYANLGVVEDSVGWTADESVTGQEYAASAQEWIDAGARLVGGCCGTRPAHIAAIRDALTLPSVSAAR
jgi:homocysteine S-methyltransferase